MKLPPGFKPTVFAAEPDVQNPIALAWDARGRLWVAENYTYAERTRKFELRLRDRVLIFEDRDGDGRACVEQRIEELQHDLAADGFCLQPCYATESAFPAVRLTFNRLSLDQHQTTPEAPYRQPGTLRVGVFLCGAVLGVMGREVVVNLSAAWGGLGKHRPLVEASLDWLKCASPQLVPPEDRLPIGGGLI